MKPAIVIVYKGRYGATAQYAQLLSQRLRVAAYESSEISDAKLKKYDVIIAGGSVYVGKIQIAKWINKRLDILMNKKVYLFVVCASPDINEAERAVMLSRNIHSTLVTRMNVSFLKGRMIKRNLSFIDYVFLRIGAALQKNAADRKRMLTDFDEVKKENLDDLVKKVNSLVSLETSSK